MTPALHGFFLPGKMGMRSLSRQAVKDFVGKHFAIAPVATTNPGKGGRRAKNNGGEATEGFVPLADAEGAAAAAPEAKAKAKAKGKAKAAPKTAPTAEAGPAAAKGPEASLGTKRLFQYACKRCPNFMCKDASNSRALEHVLLIEGAAVRLCADPQVTAEELRSLELAG